MMSLIFYSAQQITSWKKILKQTIVSMYNHRPTAVYNAHKENATSIAYFMYVHVLLAKVHISVPILIFLSLEVCPNATIPSNGCRWDGQFTLEQSGFGKRSIGRITLSGALNFISILSKNVLSSCELATRVQTAAFTKP